MKGLQLSVHGFVSSIMGQWGQGAVEVINILDTLKPNSMFNDPNYLLH